MEKFRFLGAKRNCRGHFTSLFHLKSNILYLKIKNLNFGVLDILFTLLSMIKCKNNFTFTNSKVYKSQGSVLGLEAVTTTAIAATPLPTPPCVLPIHSTSCDLLIANWPGADSEGTGRAPWSPCKYFFPHIFTLHELSIFLPLQISIPSPGKILYSPLLLPFSRDCNS